MSLKQRLERLEQEAGIGQDKPYLPISIPDAMSPADRERHDNDQMSEQEYNDFIARYCAERGYDPDKDDVLVIHRTFANTDGTVTPSWCKGRGANLR